MPENTPPRRSERLWSEEVGMAEAGSPMPQMDPGYLWSNSRTFHSGHGAHGGHTTPPPPAPMAFDVATAQGQKSAAAAAVTMATRVSGGQSQGVFALASVAGTPPVVASDVTVALHQAQHVAASASQSMSATITTSQAQEVDAALHQSNSVVSTSQGQGSFGQMSIAAVPPVINTIATVAQAQAQHASGVLGLSGAAVALAQAQHTAGTLGVSMSAVVAMFQAQRAQAVAAATTTTTPALVPNRFVSPSGSDSNPGSENQPWKTWAKAIASAVAGDVVGFLDGTYVQGQINISTSGTQANPITFMSINRWGAVVSGVRGTDLQPAISVSASWITLKDFLVQTDPSSSPVTQYTSSNCDIRCWNSVDPHPGNDTSGRVGVHLDGLKCTSTSAQRAVGIKSNLDFTLIENCVVANCIELFNCKQSVIRNNTVTGQEQGGVSILAKGGVRSAQIYGNVVHNTYSEGTAIILGGTSIASSMWSTTAMVEAYNCVAFNNVVLNESTGSCEALQLCGAESCAFFNNVVVGKATIGSRSSPNNLIPSHNPKFENNIVKGVSGSWSTGTPSAAGWNFTGTSVVDYNNFSGYSSVPVQAHAVTGNPLFVSTSDWHLQAGSPCSHAGTALTFTGFYGEAIDLTVDAAGNTRSVPWSLGIYA